MAAILPGANCVLCDKVGRRNAVKIVCASCGLFFHKTCLVKSQQWTDKELNIFRREKNYMCWACSVPAFNDSFWSIPETPRVPTQTPAAGRRRGKKNAVSVVCFNARSLKNRRTAATIAAFFETHSADVCAVNETWLQPDVKNHEFVPREYVVLRNDRLGSRGGGALLAIRPHLQPKRLAHLEGRAEVVWAEIRVGSLRLLVGSAYRQPNADAAYNASLLHSLDLVSAEQPNYDGCLLMGDFNLNIRWQEDPPCAEDAVAKDFQSAFADMAFEQLVTEPTRTTETCEKTIDLLLCDAPALIAAVKVVPGVSDHDAILANLSLSAVQPSSGSREVIDYQRANWPALIDALTHRLQDVLQFEDVNEAWEKWKGIVEECTEQHVPKKRIGGGKKSGLLPWIDSGLKKLISVRDQLFARWRETKGQGARDDYVSARRSTQAALRTAKDNWMWRLGQGEGGSKFFWNYINSRATVPNDAASFDDGRVTLTDPKEIANKFSEIFQGNFSRADNIFPYVRRNAATSSPSDTSILSELVCTPADVHVLLRQTKTNKAPGPDSVPASLLKNAATGLCVSLAHIFNLSLAQGLPTDWKTAYVVAIHKDGNKRDMRNYRPISITSLVGKTLERFVRDRASDFFENRGVIPSSQHGFRKKRSCITLLTGAIDSWTAKLDEQRGAHIHCIFLDWSKAFDKVPHSRLLSKLEHYGIKGNLLKWFESFLVGRTQYVNFNGECSEVTEVPSGVVQGSVIGPLMYCVFSADMEVPPDTDMDTYADDATASRVVETQEDADALQRTLDCVKIWSDNNGMELNALKCKVMDITRAQQPLYFLYTIDGVPLEYVDRQRLLGVHLSSDLRWSVHTDTVRAKSAQVLSFAARNLQGCSPRIKRMAYLSLVKPIWSFGLPAWHPSNEADAKKLESVQKRALHFIHGRNLPLVSDQKIMPVAMHLQHTDVTFFKRCISGAIDFDARAQITEGRAHRSDSGSHHPRLQPPPGLE